MSGHLYQYEADQIEGQHRYLELIRDYQDQPQDGRVRSSNLSMELDRLECAMLDHPPVYTNGLGELEVRRKGLILPTVADFSMVRDAPTGDFQVIQPNRWAELIAGQDAVDLTPLFTHKLDQNGHGSCGAEGLTQGCMLALAKATGKAPPLLNPLFMYHTTSGGRDQGSSLQANIAFALKHGVASEAVWSRKRGFLSIPSPAAYADARNYMLLEYSQVRNWIEFGTALLLGWPVYFGYLGHAIVAITLLDEERFRFANSWSVGWGDQGAGTLHKDRIYWSYGAYAIRVITSRLAA